MTEEVLAIERVQLEAPVVHAFLGSLRGKLHVALWVLETVAIVKVEGRRDHCPADGFCLCSLLTGGYVETYGKGSQGSSPFARDFSDPNKTELLFE